MTGVMHRRSLLKGLAACLAAPALIIPRSARAATLPVQVLPSINGVAIEPGDFLFYWGPSQGGDVGTSVRVFAYPGRAWHMTGYSGGILTNPNVPIMPDRTVTVRGSDDNDCFGQMFTLSATDTVNGISPYCMNNRTCDPLHDGSKDGSFLFVRPEFGGSLNPAGPDCGMLLFCSRLFGPRPSQ